MGSPIIIEGDCFVSRWNVDPERREEFLEIFDALWRPSADQLREVTNFVFYGWSRTGEFVAIESWKSPELVAAIRSTDEFKASVTKLMECSSANMMMEVFGGMEGGSETFDINPAGPSRVHPRTDTIEAVYI